MQKNNEKGVSLIITFFVMVILLGLHLSISTILYSEMKIIKNIGSSLVSFYLADSGAEKVLFYNARILNSQSGQAAPRGLCSMCSEEFQNSCKEDPTPGEESFEKSVYCNACEVTESVPGGCGYDSCNNCKISFTSFFDLKKKYELTAEISSTGSGSNDIFTTIESTGYYNNSVLRAVKINIKEDGGP